MLDSLRSQREEGKFCDIFLHVGGKRFPAHRSVLAASSPYFESILRNDKSTNKEEINIECEDVESFEILLDYIYSGNITIDEKNVSGLLELSTQFLITKLQGHCEQYLQLTGGDIHGDDDDDDGGGGGGTDDPGRESGGGGDDVEHDTVGAGNRKDDENTDENQDETNNNTDNHRPVKRTRRCKEMNLANVNKEEDKSLTADDDLDSSTINEVTLTPTICNTSGGGGGSSYRTSRRKIKSKYATDEWVSESTPVTRRKSANSPGAVGTGAVTVTSTVSNSSSTGGDRGSGEDTQAIASIQSGDDEDILALDESSDDQRPDGQSMKASLAQWKEGVKCPHCSYTGHSMHRLEQHLFKTHEDDTTYKCRLCDFTCKWNREYYRHMKCHFEGPPFKCEDCEYTCDRIQFILSHRMRHTDERPFNCEMCPFKSRTKGNLIVHMRIHTGEKPYKCQFCDRGFAMKNTLDQHLATHRADRPFLCDTCGFTTKYQSHLLSHKRIHTGNVFHCTHEGCNYFSPRRSQLAAHERSHSSIRSHICVTCGRGFIEKSHLIRHERIHLEDKPFKCTECDYESTRRDKLKEHVLKHHSGDSKSQVSYKPRKSRRQSQVTVIEESSIPELSDSQLIVTTSPGDIQIVQSEQEVATANLIYEYQTDGDTPVTKTVVIQNMGDGEGDSCYLQLAATSS